MKLVSFRQLWVLMSCISSSCGPGKMCVPTAKSCATPSRVVMLKLLYDNVTISCKEDPAVLPKAGLSDK